MATKTVETYGRRVSLSVVREDLAVKVAATVADGHIVKVGDAAGMITASELARRRTRTDATGTGFATTSPTGQVVDASVFKAGDVLKNEAGTTIGTVLSVNPAATPDTVTLAANAAVAVAAGASVLGSDGSQVAKFISENETDGAGDTPVTAIIGGFLNESLLRGIDSSARAELGGMSTVGGIFKF